MYKLLTFCNTLMKWLKALESTRVLCVSMPCATLKHKYSPNKIRYLYPHDFFCVQKRKRIKERKLLQKHIYIYTYIFQQ